MLPTPVDPGCADITKGEEPGAREGSAASEPAAKHYLYDTIFNGISQKLALACLIASFLLPIDGGGFTVCWFYNLFDLPCPGCGLGRSVTNMSHLDVVAAFGYHPWGVPIYALIVVLAASNFFPQRWRDAMRTGMIQREPRLQWFYWTFIGTFLVYGFARLGYMVVNSAG